MNKKNQNRSVDPHRLAAIVSSDSSSDQDDRLLTEDGRNLAAVLLGRKGGLKGGKARAENLTAEERREIARRAAAARWGTKSD